MAQLRVDHSGKKYLVEWSQEGIEVSKLVKAQGMAHKLMIAKHDKDIVKALFISDYEDRGVHEVSDDLGEHAVNVRTIIHRIRKGKNISDSLYQKLKTLYKIDEVLE